MLTVLAVVAFCAATACASKTPPPPPANESGRADWSSFGGHARRGAAENMRTVPESPAPVTGVPYLRSLRLAWSTSTDVPTWEPTNQTRELPATALQAVLAVDARSIPSDVSLRVNWYYDDLAGDPIFADALESAEDGEHYFALCLREKGHLVPLPRGEYKVELLDKATSLKSIPFEVVESEEQP